MKSRPAMPFRSITRGGAYVTASPSTGDRLLALASRLGCPFLDADDFHPPENVAKMASGTPLTDEDRWPWLDRIADELRRIEAAGGSAVSGFAASRGPATRPCTIRTCPIAR